ncbi:pentapeptide repeat-containing protein [Spongiactinospora sp. 9N601]|uniref:pentapeptide repeat-containing protein n=1 Tax=Spongiactinospora sp. 9N601 TaxID=3375149 RepID=UPI0037ADCE4F
MRDPAKPVLTAAGLVFLTGLVWVLGPGALWVLEHIDGVGGLAGKELAAAIDATRGRALTMATGTAALVAVYYTARNADTARRTFQLGERGHDTDRYGKAAEQLGHSQAPVRLAGLYALERLAQNNPALRQTIADVICAYLRMPYHPPRENERLRRIRAAQRAYHARLARRPAPAQGRDPHEERQVRLTAQRILADHLRRCASPPQGRRARAATPADRFWPGIRLDLTGATLIDFDFQDCRAASARFSDALFWGDAVFRAARFEREAEFGAAEFTGRARFGGAEFGGRAGFGDVVFHDDAEFGGAEFLDNAWFGKARFGGDAGFGGAEFAGGAGFADAEFGGRAAFGEAKFAGRADFQDAVFSGSARFGKAGFAQRAEFRGAAFTGRTDFEEAEFVRAAGFGAATLLSDARFQVRRGADQAATDGAAMTYVAAPPARRSPESLPEEEADRV